MNAASVDKGIQVKGQQKNHDTCYLMKLQMLYSVATVMNQCLPDIFGVVFVYRWHVTQLVAPSTSFPEHGEYFDRLVAGGATIGSPTALQLKLCC